MRRNVLILCAVLSVSQLFANRLWAQGALVPLERDGERSVLPGRSVEDRLDRLESELTALADFLGVRLARTDSGVRVVPETTGRLLRMEGALRELRNGAVSPVPRRGVLVVTNHRGTYVVLHVNGTDYTIAPGVTEITVPYGPVTAYQRYFEASRLWNHWYVNHWNGRYELHIHLP